MRILVTGANGLLGYYLQCALRGRGHQVLLTSRGVNRYPDLVDGMAYQSLDISDGVAVAECLRKFKPEAIIHAAACTQADDCELNPVTCWNTNVTATRFLLDAAKDLQSFFVYISTDFVFNGLNGPYLETDRPEPVNVYGCSKWVAERAVIESGLYWAILRTVLVYGKTTGEGRQNLVQWVYRELIAGRTIRVVQDQVRTPTYAADLAWAVITCVENRSEGIYHVSGEETWTPFQIAEEVAQFHHLNKGLIVPVTADTFTQPALRPPRTGFIIEKAKHTWGYRPRSLREGLRRIFQIP